MTQVDVAELYIRSTQKREVEATGDGGGGGGVGGGGSPPPELLGVTRPMGWKRERESGSHTINGEHQKPKTLVGKATLSFLISV